LKATEHNVVGVKRRLAAEERLRLERLTQRLQALPGTWDPRVKWEIVAFVRHAFARAKSGI